MARYYVSDGKDLVCVKGGKMHCYPAHLLPGTPEPGSFHDQKLEETTKDINAILEVAKLNPPQGRGLAIIAAPDGLFLVWVKNEEDEEEADVIRRFLKTKPENL